MKSPIILRIFKNDQLLEVKQFEQDQVIFGSEADVLVRLQDDNISAIHCLIERRDSGYYVCDLGSASGTYKNGNQVLDEAITSGDKITVGPFTIHFFVGVPKPKTPPAGQVSAQPTPPVAKPPPPAPKAPVATKPSQTPAAPSLPESGKVENKSRPVAKSTSKKHKGTKTFAPPSDIDLKTSLRAGKGPKVEVIVAWKERVLSTYHFESGEKAQLGSDSEKGIFIPPGFIPAPMPFIDMTGGCHIALPPNARAEFIGSQKPAPVGATLLEQGDLLCLSFEGGLLQIFVRFGPASSKPLMAPLLDFTTGEITGIVVALVLVALVGLYMSVYTPPIAEEKKEDDQVRLAQFIYNKPTPAPTPTPEPVKVPPASKEVAATPTPTPPPKKVVVKVTDQKQEQKNVGKKDSKAAATQRPSAKAQEVREIPSKVDRPKKFTSAIKQGGSVKTAKVEGSNMQSNKDVSKTGLMAAFGGGGTRKSLDKAYSGAGDIIGLANKATGSAGSSENRGGDDLGGKFKDTGAGGKGTATSGIAGVGTKGRSSGQSEYGGLGFGGKGSVAIDAGGSEALFVGSIDREAVRRVVRSKLSEIKNCYERALNLDKSLEGKVVIRFVIEDQGRVRIANTKSSTLHNRSVEECVASRIKNAIFPEPPPGTVAEVDYPFVFGSQN